MKETDNEEKFCADCVHYLAHYTKCKTYFCKLEKGHCARWRMKDVSADKKACGRFEQKDAEVKKEERELSVCIKLERIEKTLQGLLDIFSSKD